MVHANVVWLIVNRMGWLLWR